LGLTLITLKCVNNAINFYDIDGQITMKSYLRKYFVETDRVILVVDSGDKLTLKNCDEEFNLLK
jgi:hypothetical protein